LSPDCDNEILPFKVDKVNLKLDNAYLIQSLLTLSNECNPFYSQLKVNSLLWQFTPQLISVFLP